MEESSRIFPSSQDRKPASSSPQSNTKTSAYLQALEFTVSKAGLVVPVFHWALVLHTRKDDADWNAYAEAHFGGYREAVDTLTLSLPDGGRAYIWQDPHDSLTHGETQALSVLRCGDVLPLRGVKVVSSRVEPAKKGEYAKANPRHTLDAPFGGKTKEGDHNRVGMEKGSPTTALPDDIAQAVASALNRRLGTHGRVFDAEEAGEALP